MSTFTSEPGTRLGGRYRLEDRLAAAGGWSAWKAIDEILARPVSVITFAAGFPRLEQVVTAARAASRLTDTRLTQVFDVEDDWDHAYIVLEWPVGDTLTDLLGAGPLEPLAGARIIAEAAAALAGAHAAGLAHLCLRPDRCAGRLAAESRSPASASTRRYPASPPMIRRSRIPRVWASCCTRRLPVCGRVRNIPACRQRHCPMDSRGVPGRSVRACRRRSTTSPAGRSPCRDGMATFHSPSPSQLAGTLAAVIPPVQVPPAGHSRPRFPARNRPDGAHAADTAPAGPGPGTQPGKKSRPSRRVAVRRHGRPDPADAERRQASCPDASCCRRSRGRDRRGAVAAQTAPRRSGRPAPPLGQPKQPGCPLTPQSASGFDPLNPGDIGRRELRPGSVRAQRHQRRLEHPVLLHPQFGGLKAGVGLILNMGTVRPGNDHKGAIRQCSRRARQIKVGVLPPGPPRT